MKRQEEDIPDKAVRRQAETTFDRNVVMVAGAGTGKTTLLVNRLVYLLMREPHPVEITRLVALTFTNKAATEMRIRLRERLARLQAADADARDGVDPGAVTVEDLQDRYGLTRTQIVARARAALRDLEKAQIGTLHSFAAHLLRLYPLESGVDPDFQTDDDEGRFEEHFAAQWELWLDRELRPESQQAARWRRVLAGYSLEQVWDLAYALRSELIPLDELRRQVDDDALAPALRDWLAGNRDRTDALRNSHEPPKRLRKIETMLAAAQAVLGALVERGPEGLAVLDGARRSELKRSLGERPKGWSDDEFAEADRLVALAQQALSVDRPFMQDLLALLCPFVQQVRTSFLRQGWVSFDGLLANARLLLRTHLGIRERLKHEYQAVLVDEFQDTDPVQYEIILYLAERAGRHGIEWRTIELEPGKLFIVGDPKQSIYAFRRADIEAFEQVVKKVTGAGGIAHSLTTNFRSDARVLDVVNPLFDRLLIQRENVQPPNVPLVVRPNRRSRLAHPGVELRLVRAEPGGEDVESAAATRLEADQLARWLKEELLGEESMTDADGRREPLRPGHVALLFRKLTQAQDYLDALRRHGLLYVTDGEKHFYRRQEVIDLINVLRAVENSHDTIALVGVLRSALGGVTDRELVELRERSALDYRHAERLEGWASPRIEAVRQLYRRMDDVRRAAPGLPLPEAMDLIFDTLPVLELAAVSLHGEQAVANLFKVRQMAVKLAERPHLTLTAFVELMMARLEEQPEEAESALAEESLEAVRVLTIHKAKGLEFPVVILPGFHHGIGRGREAPPVSHDWATGVFGINFGGRCSLGAVLVNEKIRLREEAERRRLFYVGMTRAKERLILSGGLPSHPSPGTFMGLLKEAVTGEVGEAGQPALHIGPVPLAHTVVTVTDRPPRRRQKTTPVRLRALSDWKKAVARWTQRDQAWAAIRSFPIQVTPTRLQQAGRPVPVQASRAAAGAERGQLIGTLAHRVLQQWEFSRPPDELRGLIARVCRAGVPIEWAERADEIQRELEQLLRSFAASVPYRELQRATILGREVPFTMPWPVSPAQHSALSTQHCIMEGVIDVVYRLDGKIRLADYKTDRVEDSRLAARAAEYGVQARVYRAAVARCLGITDVGCDVIFVRNGTSVSV